jgi:glycosyltransferase involved in cell wall biosynthesis
MAEGGGDMLTVGFLIPQGLSDWLGGVNYFENLVGAICEHEHSSITPLLFVPPDQTDFYRKRFPNSVVRQLPCQSTKTAIGLLARIVRRLTGVDHVLERSLGSHNVAVLSHTFGAYKVRVPCIGWIPDFQHLHLPANFSGPELAKRDSNYREICAHSNRLFLSSQAALDDLKVFCPEHAWKGRLFRFVTRAPDHQSLPTFTDLRRKYALPERYLYLPNQFWVHKNHGIVIEALALLGPKSPTVVASGSPKDPRKPGHFESLIARAKTLGVADRFVSLGVVPYSDVLGLLAHSAAVINPSRFEGWSTTVEEALSFGKPMILSDIPVHREQTEDQAHYFSPDDANTLATHLAANSWRIPVPTWQRSRKQFARTFRDIVTEACPRA